MCLIQNTTVDKQLLTYHFKVAQNWAPETWSLCLPRGLLCTASEIAKHEGMLYAHVAPAFQLSSYSRVLKRTGSRAGIPGFGPWLDHYVTLRKRTLPAKCTNFLLGNMQIILVSSSQGSCRNQLAHIKDLLNEIQSTQVILSHPDQIPEETRTETIPYEGWCEMAGSGIFWELSCHHEMMDPKQGRHGSFAIMIQLPHEIIDPDAAQSAGPAWLH